MRGLIVDLFAGGGGASLGIERATGRSPDYAINHDKIALGVHERNHPATKHLHGDVWHYHPRDVVGDREVELLWLSPTCVHFSQAKGAPLDRREASKSRALAWVGPRWAREKRPRLICHENVAPFEKWGPLGNDGKVRPGKDGFTFRRWVREYTREGYNVEWRRLRACDFGAPTIRDRLFVQASLDPIVWPDATHGPGLIPHRGAIECIDWSIPAPSIFAPGRNLVEATMRRVARGVRKHVLKAARPFILSQYGTARGGRSIDESLPTVLAGRSKEYLVVPSLVHLSNGERPGQAPRIYDPQKPLSTIVAGGVKHGLVAAMLVKHFGGHEGSGMSVLDPLGAVTTRDHHALVTCMLGDRREEVRSFLRRFREDAWKERFLRGSPAQTSLFGEADDDLVRVDGEVYAIADIGMRNLAPRELARGQGFHDGYVIEETASGQPVSLTKQVALIGNSVAPHVAEALVRANWDNAAADRRVA